MADIIFDQEAMINGNIFQFEKRLQSMSNRIIENGTLLTTYWRLDENATTVDRGTREVERLFGKDSPIRWNQIHNFPLNGVQRLEVENTDESQIEDINVNGEGIILPMTIVPHPNDFFMMNHLKMRAIFRVTAVINDSMRVEGFYKIQYELFSTSQEIETNLRNQSNGTFFRELNAIGTSTNPIIREDDFIHRTQVSKMLSQMIESYKALFYNTRHNCFLFHDQQLGQRIFDLCANEFMYKHSLMNNPGSMDIVVLHEKLKDQNFLFLYNASVYNWLELDAPPRMVRHFHYQLAPGEYYRDSSFARWAENDISVIQPLSTQQVGIHSQDHSIFDGDQLSAFMQDKVEPTSEFDKIIWKFMNFPSTMSVRDISLYTADTLINSVRRIDVYLYTPIVIYIIRKLLRMN